jgi:hypothetical protein
MATALAITLIAFTFIFFVHPAAWADGTLDHRLRLLGLCALVPAVSLAFAIARLASYRFRSPQDIDGSGLEPGSDRAHLLQALLQNTLEQATLALGVYAAWALIAPARGVALLPVAALLFVLGRSLFFRGYAGGAAARALGFALTFYPTLVLLAGAIVIGVFFAGS